MKSREYYAGVQKAILAAPHVIQTRISFDEISEEECYVKGEITFNNGYELYIAEYVVTEPEFKRLKYRFHFQKSNGQMVVRWDNSPHHPKIESHPDHVHVGKKVRANHPMDISQVLDAVLSFIE
ncbi:MAG: hypothetical protein C3F07_15125 [Anaerolineales bacterium]|nr:MAG: hypothetical protein C3F07_15125 [Anaerolineales bacterium]